MPFLHEAAPLDQLAVMIPYLRVTIEMLMPGFSDSSMIALSCSGVNRRRLYTDVTTATRSIFLPPLWLMIIVITYGYD